MSQIWTPPEAAQQGGVFTISQARAVAYSEREVARARKVDWVCVAGKVYAARTQEITAVHRAWAAGLWRAEAVVCLASAAALHKLPVDDGGRGHLWMASYSKPPRGLRAHVFSLAPEDIESYGTIRVTGLRATAVELIARGPIEDAFPVVSWVISRELVSADVVATAADARFGHRGVALLRRFLRYFESGAASELEFRAHRMLRSAGIGGWEPNKAITIGGVVRFSADILFERHRVIIELDGMRYHDPEVDARRTLELERAGYRVLRFGWWNITKGSHQTLSIIRAALAEAEARWSPRTWPRSSA